MAGLTHRGALHCGTLRLSVLALWQTAWIHPAHDALNRLLHRHLTALLCLVLAQLTQANSKRESGGLEPPHVCHGERAEDLRVEVRQFVFVRSGVGRTGKFSVDMRCQLAPLCRGEVLGLPRLLPRLLVGSLLVVLRVAVAVHQCRPGSAAPQFRAVERHARPADANLPSVCARVRCVRCLALEQRVKFRRPRNLLRPSRAIDGRLPGHHVGAREHEGVHICLVADLLTY